PPVASFDDSNEALSDAPSERRLHRWRRVKSAEHHDRCNRRCGEFSRYIGGDAGEAKYVNVELFVCGLGGFQVLSREVLQAEHHRSPRHRFGEDLRVHRKLIADRRTNHVGAVRVKAFFDQQVYLPEVDRTQVDGDFFGVAALWAGTVDEAEFGHWDSDGIQLPSKEHLT